MQPNSNVSRRQRIVRQADYLCAAPIISNISAGKGMPVCWQSLRQIFRPDKVAMLDGKLGREGFAPGDLDGVHACDLAQIDHHPLRMNRILLAGEMFIQIRIALPKSLWVAVVDERVTVILG